MDVRPKGGLFVIFWITIGRRWAETFLFAGWMREIWRFDPNLRRGYMAEQGWEADLQRGAQAIAACDHLVVGFPLWGVASRPC